MCETVSKSHNPSILGYNCDRTVGKDSSYMGKCIWVYMLVGIRSMYDPIHIFDWTFFKFIVMVEL